MSKVIYKKLDKRNSGYPIWKYYINRPRSLFSNRVSLFESNQRFYIWRAWCWETWGPSKELAAWIVDSQHTGIEMPECQNEHWTWISDQYQYINRIYLRSDEELSMFILRWSGD